MAEWRYSVNGEQFGPVNSSELRQLTIDGKISSTDFVWREGLSDWVPAGKVKGLFPPAPAVPAKPVEPVPPPLPITPLPLPLPVAQPAAIALPPIMNYPATAESFRVFVRSTLPNIGKGNFTCTLNPTGVVLTHKNRQQIQLPLGTKTQYLGANRFTAAVQDQSIEIRLNLTAKYNNRMAHDLAAFIEGRGSMPVKAQYTLPWYFAVPVFFPLGILLIAIGGIPLMIAGAAMGANSYIVQQEKWKTLLRVLASLGVALAAYLLVIAIIWPTLAQRNKQPAPAIVMPGPSNSYTSSSSSSSSSTPPVINRPPHALPAPKIDSPKLTQAELDAKLQKIVASWKTPGSTPVDLLATLKDQHQRQSDGSITLKKLGNFMTPAKYQPPAVFRIVVQSHGQELRISYAAREIIFNWGANHDELRIEGGPANGQHKKGAGGLSDNNWAGIELVVHPDEMVIYVDGEERQRVQADFSKINGPLKIRPYGAAGAEIRSVEIVQP